MRRADLINGAATVRAAIEHCEIFPIIEKMMDRRHNTKAEAGGFNSDLLIALQRYSLSEAKFGKVERQIALIMGLEHLANPKFWPQLLIVEQGPPVFEIRRALYHFRDFLPKFLNLIEQDFVEVMKHNPNKAPSNFQGKALVTVIIVEEKDSFSNPRRVIETLEAMELFYNAVSILNGESAEQKMILLACDSGSDKSFDFLGLAKLVEMVVHPIT